MRNLKLILIVVLGLITFRLIGSTNIDEIKTDETIKLLKENKITLVDVREKDEFDAGHIEGAKHIPLSLMKDNKSEFDKLFKEASKNNSQEVLVYCRTGRRSGLAKDELLKQNYKVKNIGGFENLVKQGFTSAK